MKEVPNVTVLRSGAMRRPVEDAIEAAKRHHRAMTTTDTRRKPEPKPPAYINADNVDKLNGLIHEGQAVQVYRDSKGRLRYSATERTEGGRL